jgi:hypothetical protein
MSNSLVRSLDTSLWVGGWKRNLRAGNAPVFESFTGENVRRKRGVRYSQEFGSTKRCIFYDLEWRRGWDSNPRALADKTLSRRPRYDHFGTSPLFTPLGGALFTFPTSLRARAAAPRRFLPALACLTSLGGAS